MKTKLICCLLVPVFTGCSKHEPAANVSSPAEASSRPNITVVVSDQTKRNNDIQSQALTLFSNRDFAGLEDFAAKLRASKESMADGSWELAFVYDALAPKEADSDAVWQARLAQVREWSKARPQTVMSRIALARILKDYAWKARGTDTADKVGEQNWPVFFERLKSAEATLYQAKQLKDPCPVYWSTLQRVALGLQYEKEQYNAVFVQAIKEYPDYPYYYTARAYYLLPRWNGEEGEWEQDLTKSADRLGGDAGDILYARVFWGLFMITPSEVGQILSHKRSSWERVDRGFELIMKQFPDSLEAKNQRANLAAMAGQRDKARTYFLAGKGEVNLSQFGDREDLDRFLDWTFGPR